MGRVGKDREISIMPEQSTGAASATAPSREHFASRLGFILISAGCAIGLGNVWRFPYITGQYGGAAFFLIYLVFLSDFRVACHGDGIRGWARIAEIGRAGVR